MFLLDQCWVCGLTHLDTGHMVRDDKLRDAVKMYTDPEPEAAKSVLEDNSETFNGDLDLSKMVRDGVLSIVTELMIKVPDPTAVTKLKDGSILVCQGQAVVRYSREGERLPSSVRMPNNKDFCFPNGVIQCRDGDVVISDKRGLHVFNPELLFLKSLLEAEECFGVAEDQHGNILTITRTVSPISTKVIIIDKESEVHKKVFDMNELIEEVVESLNENLNQEDCHTLLASRMSSQCSSIDFKMGTIYVTGTQLIS